MGQAVHPTFKDQIIKGPFAFPSWYKACTNTERKKKFFSYLFSSNKSRIFRLLMKAETGKQQENHLYVFLHTYFQSTMYFIGYRGDV